LIPCELPVRLTEVPRGKSSALPNPKKQNARSQRRSYLCTI
jgi:hypothetical protein